MALFLIHIVNPSNYCGCVCVFVLKQFKLSLTQVSHKRIVAFRLVYNGVRLFVWVAEQIVYKVYFRNGF